MLTLLMMFMVSAFLYMVTLMNMNNNQNKEKLNAFECGFNPFFAPQKSFSLQFFKILMIFLLFDMELIIILPTPIFQPMNYFCLTSMSMILLILIIGLLFEWKEGSLNWLK